MSAYQYNLSQQSEMRYRQDRWHELNGYPDDDIKLSKQQLADIKERQQKRKELREQEEREKAAKGYHRIFGYPKKRI